MRARTYTFVGRSGARLLITLSRAGADFRHHLCQVPLAGLQGGLHRDVPLFHRRANETPGRSIVVRSMLRKVLLDRSGASRLLSALAWL